MVTANTLDLTNRTLRKLTYDALTIAQTLGYQSNAAVNEKPQRDHQAFVVNIDNLELPIVLKNDCGVCGWKL